MSYEESDVSSLLKDREVLLQLSPMRIIMKKPLPPIDLRSLKLDGLGIGSSVEVPRWVGELLVNLGFASAPEENFETELFKALSRERMQGPLQLSTLKPDFYVKLASFLRNASQMTPQWERISVASRDLVLYRTNKLLYLASGTIPPSDVLDKTTPEERKMIEIVNEIVQDWMKALLGEM